MDSSGLGWSLSLKGVQESGTGMVSENFCAALFSTVFAYNHLFSGRLIDNVYTDSKKNSTTEDSSSGNVDQQSTTKITVDSQTRRTLADDTTTSGGTDEFDVYTLPHVEWKRIEESLRASAGEHKKRWVRLASIIIVNFCLFFSIKMARHRRSYCDLRLWPCCVR